VLVNWVVLASVKLAVAEHPQVRVWVILILAPGKWAALELVNLAELQRVVRQFRQVPAKLPAQDLRLIRLEWPLVVVEAVGQVVPEALAEDSIQWAPGLRRAEIVPAAGQAEVSAVLLRDRLPQTMSIKALAVVLLHPLTPPHRLVGHRHPRLRNNRTAWVLQPERPGSREVALQRPLEQQKSPKTRLTKRNNSQGHVKLIIQIIQK
jgi:hypothetical protein